MPKIAIIGAGAIGSAMAAYLSAQGHAVALWSRSFSRHPQADADRLTLTTTGAVIGQFHVQKLPSLSDVSDFPIVIVALPATAYADVLPALARELTADHMVIFSGALSLAPLWLYELAHRRPTVCAWGTTFLAGGFQRDGTLYIPFIRKEFGLACLPPSKEQEALALCTSLFPIAFHPAPSVLDICLSNINPIAHAGQMLINFSRIDRGETWKLFENFTPSGIHIAEALDSERLAIADTYGAEVRTLQRHYALSYPVDDDTVTVMVRQISEKGSKTLGPVSYDHRYLCEDIPYGLAFFERLAHLAKREVPQISAVISLLEVMTRLDLRSNDILDQLIIKDDTHRSLVDRCLAKEVAPAISM